MKEELHKKLIIIGIILQIITIIPALLFIWRFIIRKIINPNPIRKYKQKESYALITGASEGVGKAYAKRLAKEGFNLILIARRKQLLQEIKEELESQYKIDVIILNYDMLNMTDEQWNEIEQLLSEKNVTALFNNVAMSTKGKYHEIEITKIKNVVSLNIDVMLKTTHLFINHTKSTQKNLIVFVSSVTAGQDSPCLSMYASTKSFIKQFGRSISYEYKHIDCTVFVPWHISTEMIGNMKPVLGVATADEFAESCFVHVGLTNCIDPFIPHYLQDWGYSIVRNEKKNKSSLEEYETFARQRAENGIVNNQN